MYLRLAQSLLSTKSCFKLESPCFTFGVVGLQVCATIPSSDYFWTGYYFLTPVLGIKRNGLGPHMVGPQSLRISVPQKHLLVSCG